MGQVRYGDGEKILKGVRVCTCVAILVQTIFSFKSVSAFLRYEGILAMPQNFE